MIQHTDATLLGWLSSRPEKLERHLERHPEDIDRVDRLTALEADQLDAVERSVAAPDDIAERVISRIKIDPKLREAGIAFADLFTLGIRTMQVVLTTPDDEPTSGSDDEETAT